jgi:hypothetical protein
MTKTDAERIAEFRQTLTPLHLERGRQMRKVVQHDVVRRGYSFEEAVDALATHLEIDSETVKLAIAIANDADDLEQIEVPA